MLSAFIYKNYQFINIIANKIKKVNNQFWKIKKVLAKINPGPNQKRMLFTQSCCEFDKSVHISEIAHQPHRDADSA
jgi:hypothetical protein